jgi:hypothetical protein
MTSKIIIKLSNPGGELDRIELPGDDAWKDSDAMIDAVRQLTRWGVRVGDVITVTEVE